MSLNKGRPQWSDESGFSLVGILVSIAVLSVCVLMFSQARQYSLKSRKNIDSVAMVGDVNDAVVAEISKIVRLVDTANPGCLDYAAQITNRPFLSSALNFSTTLNNSAGFSTKLAEKDKTRLLEILGSDTYQGVVNRCRSPLRPASGTDPAQNLFHLCMTIKQDASAPSGSFLNAPYAFAEVGWQLINIQTGANMSCADFKASSAAAGARVFYSLYWAIPVGGEMMLKKSINSFTMGK